MQKYRPHIEKFIEELPHLSTLSDFKWDIAKRPNITLFGGVLRWIVERVEASLDVDLKSFLKVGSDIDIKVDGRSEDALRTFFQECVSNSEAIVEYIGVRYGGTDPKTGDAHPDQKLECSYATGNYMVYIPVRSGVQPPNGYLKYDIAFGKKMMNAEIDFTANALTYPHAYYQHDFIFRCIQDIKNRRAIRCSAKEHPKSVYRLSKMLDRGYIPIDRIAAYRWYLECIEAVKDSTKATLADTKCPIVCPSVCLDGKIQGSKHVFTEVTVEFVSTLPSIVKFFDGLSPFPLLPPSTKSSSKKGGGFEPVKTKRGKKKEGKGTDVYVLPKLYRSFPDPLPTWKKGVTRTDVKVYKAVYLETTSSRKSLVCLEMLVPEGVEYFSGYGTGLYRFKSVIPIRVLAYPNIPISVPSGAKLTPPYWTCCTEYVLHKETRALLDGEDIPLDSVNQHGIYAFDTIEDVWCHCGGGREDIQFCPVNERINFSSFIEMLEGAEKLPSGIESVILSNYDLFKHFLKDPRFFMGKTATRVFESLTGRISERNLVFLDDFLKDERARSLVCKKNLFYETCSLSDPKALELLEILLKYGVADATGAQPSEVCESEYCNCKREDVKGAGAWEIIKAFGTPEMIKLAEECRQKFHL